MDKVKVCAYCRVSTNSKDQENSFGNQKEYFEKEISKNDNLELVEIYADKGISGTSLNKRDEFNRMLYDAGIDVRITYPDGEKRKSKAVYSYYASNRQPKFNLIITKNTSRFARNIMVVEIIRKLKDKKVYVHFLDVNKTTENESDEMLLQFLFSIDEEESKSKSRKVRFGQMRSAEKGIINVSNRIYGYSYIKEEKRLEIIPEEAEVIRQIFDLYSEGYGIRRIINYLNERNIKTREGKEFCKSTVGRILLNEKYYGCNVRNKYDTGVIFHKNSYPKKKSEDEWIYHEGVIPAIIDKELFEKCKSIKESKVNVVSQRGLYKGTSEYAGIINCSVCGNTYIRNVDRGRPFYMCSTKRIKGAKICNGLNIQLKKLEELIDKESIVMRLEELHKEYMIKMINFMLTLEGRIDKDNKMLVQQKEEEKETILQKQKKLVDLYLENHISKDEYSTRNNLLQEQIERIEREIYDLTKGNIEIEKDIEEIKAILEQMMQYKRKNIYTINRENYKESILKQIKKIIVTNNNGKPKLLFHYKLIDDMDEIIKKYQ